MQKKNISMKIFEKVRKCSKLIRKMDDKSCVQFGHVNWKRSFEDEDEQDDDDNEDEEENEKDDRNDDNKKKEKRMMIVMRRSLKLQRLMKRVREREWESVREWGREGREWGREERERVEREDDEDDKLAKSSVFLTPAVRMKLQHFFG